LSTVFKVLGLVLVRENVPIAIKTDRALHCLTLCSVYFISAKLAAAWMIRSGWCS